MQWSKWAGNKLAILGAVGGVLVLGAIAVGGGVMAQTGGGTTPSATHTPGPKGQQAKAEADSFLNALAQNLGIDRSKLDDGLKKTADQQIDLAVQSGKLTQAEATKLKQAVDSGNFPMPFAHFGDFGGRGHGVEGAAIASCATNVQQAVSQLLGGETADQIRADLKAGKSPADIAAAHGTTLQALGTAAATALQPCLDSAVKSGTITQDQENKILTDVRSGNIPALLGGFRGEHGGIKGQGRAGATPTPATH